MKPLLIDFSPRVGVLQAGVDKRHRPLWILLCVIIVVALVTTVLHAWGLENQRIEVKARLETVRNELNAAAENDSANESANQESAEAIQQANQFLNYPWGTILNSLEHSIRPQIHIISLELGVLRQSSKLVIETVDTRTALDYLDELRKEPGFTTAALVKQEAVGGDNPRMRYTFETAAARVVPRGAKAGGR